MTLEEITSIVRPHHDRIIAEAQVASLYEALTKLSNEVMGSLPLLEPLARREMGNSNYNILIQRAEEARAVLRRIAAERIDLTKGQSE